MVLEGTKGNHLFLATHILGQAPLFVLEGGVFQMSLRRLRSSIPSRPLALLGRYFRWPKGSKHFQTPPHTSKFNRLWSAFGYTAFCILFFRNPWAQDCSTLLREVTSIGFAPAVDKLKKLECAGFTVTAALKTLKGACGLWLGQPTSPRFWHQSTP